MRPTGTEKVDFSKKMEKKNQKHIYHKNKLTGRITRKTKKEPEKDKDKQLNENKHKINQNLDFPQCLMFSCVFSVLFFIFFVFGFLVCFPVCSGFVVFLFL